MMLDVSAPANPTGKKQPPMLYTAYQQETPATPVDRPAADSRFAQPVLRASLDFAVLGKAEVHAFLELITTKLETIDRLVDEEANEKEGVKTRNVHVPPVSSNSSSHKRKANPSGSGGSGSPASPKRQKQTFIGAVPREFAVADTDEPGDVETNKKKEAGKKCKGALQRISDKIDKNAVLVVYLDFDKVVTFDPSTTTWLGHVGQETLLICKLAFPFGSLVSSFATELENWRRASEHAKQSESGVYPQRPEPSRWQKILQLSRDVLELLDKLSLLQHVNATEAGHTKKTQTHFKNAQPAQLSAHLLRVAKQMQHWVADPKVDNWKPPAKSKSLVSLPDEQAGKQKHKEARAQQQADKGEGESGLEEADGDHSLTSADWASPKFLGKKGLDLAFEWMKNLADTVQKLKVAKLTDEANHRGVDGERVYPEDTPITSENFRPNYQMFEGFRSAPDIRSTNVVRPTGRHLQVALRQAEADKRK
jgi:hypothetical protein